MFRLRNLPEQMLRYNTDAAQGADGSDSGQSNSQSQSGNNSQSSQGQGGEIPQGLAAMIAKNDNNALKVAELLHGDNYQLREKNRQLQGQLEGAVVLRGDDKATWEAYKAIGAPKEIASKLRKADIERVAGKARVNPSVLARLDEMDGGKLVYEVKTETVDGKQEERVYVREGTDANAQPQLLNEYAAANWSDFLPALMPQSASQGQGNSGVRYPAQSAGSNGTQGAPDLVAKFQAEQEAKDKAVQNPLLQANSV